MAYRRKYRGMGAGATSAPAIPARVVGETFWDFLEGTQGASLTDFIKRYQVVLMAGGAIGLFALLTISRAKQS
jgi:hypothetical protein